MLLEVNGLHMAYGDIEAVCGFDLELRAGELVSIIGVNGAGKSSILQGVMGILPCRKGRIMYKGQDITGMPSHARARLGIRMVPERPRHFPASHRLREPDGRPLRASEKAAGRRKSCMALHALSGARRKERPARPDAFGGEQQQLAIARALISGPELLLIDEVSMGLMPKLVDAVFRLMQDEPRSRADNAPGGQNAAASLRISSRAYVLETGTCVLHGAAAELLENDRVRDVYMGTSTTQ